MVIRVLYKDKATGMVKDSLLDELINSGKIAAFFRSGEWVNVERDPIRGRGGAHSGPERRKTGERSTKPSDFFG